MTAKVRFEVKFMDPIIVKNARVKYLVFSTLRAPSAIVKGLDVGKYLLESRFWHVIS